MFEHRITELGQSLPPKSLVPSVIHISYGQYGRHARTAIGVSTDALVARSA
jgi:hypothetical protein